MTMIVNRTTNQTFKVAGKDIAPLEMADVNKSAKELKEHLFVRSGLVEVKGTSSGPSPKSQESGEGSE